MAARIRGSDLLKHRFTEEDLAKVLDLGEIEGVQFVDFFPLGIPAPDGARGVWHTRPEVLLELLDRLVKLERVPVIKVFPKGIPYPEMFEVAFEAGSGRRR